MILKHDIKNKLLEMKQEIEEAFTQEQEDKWKIQLEELATNPQPLKESQNFLTSKQLDYSKQLSQLLEVKNVQIK